MMTKYAFVSLANAKLLKEKGYDEPCRCFYQSIREDDADDDCFRVSKSIDFINRKEDKTRFAAPSFFQIGSWFVLYHGIYIGGGYDMFPMLDDCLWWYSITTRDINNESYCIFKRSKYYSCERDCCNAAISEALKLI